MNIETAKRLRALADRLERDERAGAERHGDNELLTFSVLHEVFGIEFWLLGPPPSLYGTPAALMDVAPTTRADYLGIDRRIYPMSATIKWEPGNRKLTTLEVATPSAFVNVMTRAFGHSPWAVSTKDHSKLEGIAAAMDTDSERQPFERMIELLNHHESIKVWPEY